jgi:GAF domain-containing protein
MGGRSPRVRSPDGYFPITGLKSGWWSVERRGRGFKVAVRVPRHVKNRYVRRLEPGRLALDELVEAIQTLLQVTSREDPQFLSHGIKLLMEHMHSDQAYLVTLVGGVLTTQWWLPEGPGGKAPPQIASLCQWLLDNPLRTLVLRDIPQDERWKDDPELKAGGIRAAAGAALLENGQVRGLVFLHYQAPHVFTRAEMALLAAVANYLSRILEIENLKSALSDLENFLAITRAVVEDSNIQDSATDLPNQRYLDIWLKANLVAASREHEVMTVAEWCLDVEAPDGVTRIREVTERIRGGDLLVSMGQGQFLLVLPRMPKGLGQIFLQRIRQKLGEIPMGATLWVPGSDDIRLESVRRRLDQAWEESRSKPAHELVWKLPEPV